MDLLPLFVKLDGRRVVVVGTGWVAASKLEMNNAHRLASSVICVISISLLESSKIPGLQIYALFLARMLRTLTEVCRVRKPPKETLKKGPRAPFSIPQSQ